MYHRLWSLSANEEEQAKEAIVLLRYTGLEEGFRLLREVFGWRIRTFARSRLGRPSRRPPHMLADQDDVEQEVFLKLFQRAAKGGRSRLGNPLGWPDDPLGWPDDALGLCNFVRFYTEEAVFKQLRLATNGKHAGHETYDEAALTVVTGRTIEAIPGVWPTPEQVASARERWRQLLCRVTKENDRALLIADLDGLSFSEIAQQFDWDERSIRRRYAGIIEQLRTFAEDSERTDSELRALLLELQSFRTGTAPCPKRLPVDPAASIDPVDCTVFSPPTVCLGDAFLVQVVVHTPSQSSEASALASEFDEDSRRRGYTSLRTHMERGSRLRFHLMMSGLQVEEPLRVLIWQGRPASVQFHVAVPSSHSEQAVIGTVIVTEEGVPQGRITFKVKVTSKSTSSLPLPSPTGRAKVFEVFFISYASEDRPEVLKRVQMLARLGKRFFQDVLHLDPGDRWERKLYVNIDQSDAVLLFWSSNAKQSEWVMRECRYTIDTKGIDYLLPVIIEGPPLVEPPPELAALHMNDWLLYLMR